MRGLTAPNQGNRDLDANALTEYSVYRESRRRFGFWLVLTFVIAVLTPTIANFFYLHYIKTAVYNSEARLSVRTNSQEAELASSGSLSQLMARTGLNTTSSDRSDIYAVQNFLLSQNAVAAVGGMPRMIQVFGDPSTDPLSRLGNSASFEDALSYWRGKVSVYVESTSGILILNVESFDADSSFQLTNDLVTASEQLLNDMTRRGRQAALESSESELRSSAAELSTSRAKLFEFQSRTGVIDPTETVSQIGALISDLRLSQLELQGLLEVSDRIGAETQARRTEREAQVNILESQIASLEDQLTGTGRSNSVASVLREYEILKMNEEIAGQMYRMNRSAYEQARRRVEEQQRFVVQVVRPVVAEKPSGPRSLTDTATLFGALSVLWGIAMLVVAAIRDR